MNIALSENSRALILELLNKELAKVSSRVLGRRWNDPTKIDLHIEARKRVLSAIVEVNLNKFQASVDAEHF